MVKFIHDSLAKVQYGLTEVDRLFVKTLVLPISQPIRFSPKSTPDLKLGFITFFR